MQCTVSFEFIYAYLNQVHTKHKNLFGYHWDQNRNKAENKCSSLQYRYSFICLFICNYKALFVCVKDRTCLRRAIPAPTASTFLDHFWCLVLFTY